MGLFLARVSMPSQCPKFLSSVLSEKLASPLSLFRRTCNQIHNIAMSVIKQNLQDYFNWKPSKFQLVIFLLGRTYNGEFTIWRNLEDFRDTKIATIIYWPLEANQLFPSRTNEIFDILHPYHTCNLLFLHGCLDIS